MPLAKLSAALEARRTQELAKLAGDLTAARQTFLGRKSVTDEIASCYYVE
jgi:hypothetical protein